MSDEDVWGWKLNPITKKQAWMVVGGPWHDWLTSRCWSLWEGCACHKDRGHDGVHQCGGECGCTWTDEQAAAAEAELQAWIMEQRS